MRVQYNALTFLPKFLHAQFSRLANLFTLCIVFLSMFEFSPIGPVSSLAPLSFVLSVAALKEIHEDYQRKKQDNEINGRPVAILRRRAAGAADSSTATTTKPAASASTSYQSSAINAVAAAAAPSPTASFESRAWRDVCVGDVVRVTRGEFFPADLVFVSSAMDGGTCYVDTANLDGETDLKIKVALPGTQHSGLLHVLCCAVLCCAVLCCGLMVWYGMCSAVGCRLLVRLPLHTHTHTQRRCTFARRHRPQRCER